MQFSEKNLSKCPLDAQAARTLLSVFTSSACCMLGLSRKTQAQLSWELFMYFYQYYLDIMYGIKISFEDWKEKNVEEGDRKTTHAFFLSIFSNLIEVLVVKGWKHLCFCGAALAAVTVLLENCVADACSLWFHPDPDLHCNEHSGQSIIHFSFSYSKTEKQTDWATDTAGRESCSVSSAGTCSSAVIPVCCVCHSWEKEKYSEQTPCVWGGLYSGCFTFQAQVFAWEYSWTTGENGVT